MNQAAEVARRAFDAARNEDQPVLGLNDVPETYEAITAQWLTGTLCKDAADAEVVAFSFDVADDGSSNRLRIFVTYNEAGRAAGLPSTVFCKAAATVDTRVMLAESGSAEAETNFYSKVRARIDFPAPEAYFAGFNPSTYAYLIMMKDVGNDVTFPNEQHYTTRAQAEQQIDTLARLHSSFYESPELGTESLPFPRWDIWWADMMRASPDFARCCDEAFGRSEPLMSPRLFARRAEIWPLTLASAAEHAHLPCTLIHSDVHLKNWFKLPDDRMGLHDWQVTTIGHWSRDLIYTIVTALTIEDRRAWAADLINLYLDKMEARGVARIAFDEALGHCRRQIMTVLAFWTITYQPAPEMTNMQPEATSEAFLKRIYAAIDDYDALDAFT